MACHEAPPLVFSVRQGSHPTRGLEDPTSEPASRAHAAATRPTQAIPCASNPRAAIRGDTTKRLVLFVTSYKAPEHLGRAVQHFGEFISVILGSASAGHSAGRTDGLAQLSKFSNEVDGNDGFSSARLASVFEHVFGGAHEAIVVFASGQMDKTSAISCAISGYQLEHHAAQHDSTDGNFARLHELAAHDVSGILIGVSVFEVRHRASSSSRLPLDCMITP